MRRNWILPLALLLCLALSACGGGEETAAYEPAAAAEALLASEAFSQPLDTLDQDIACRMYGVDASTVTGCTAYASLTAGSEGLAVLAFTDEKAAEAAMDALRDYIAGEKAAQKDYQPGEVPKLDSAILDRRGSSVALVVADDAAAAQAVLDGLG